MMKRGRYLSLLLFVLFISIACSPENQTSDNAPDTVIEEEGMATAPGTNQDNIGLPINQPSQPTVQEYIFEEDYCALTPELVEEYCDLEGPLTVANEEGMCWIKNRGNYVVGFDTLPLSEIYESYGVSDLESYIHAEIADSNAQSPTSCPVSVFPLADVPDQTFLASNYWSSTPEFPCPAQPEAANDLNDFQLFTRRGNRMGAYFTTSGNDCTLEEVKLLLRKTLLGEEVLSSRQRETLRQEAVEAARDRGESFTRCPDSLIAWWPADGHGREVIGSFDAVLSPGVHYTSGKNGQAFLIPPTETREGAFVSDTVYVSDTGIQSKLKPTQMTLSAWIKPVEVGGFVGTIIEKNPYSLYINGEGGTNALFPVFSLQGKQDAWRTVQPLNERLQSNEWVHIAATANEGLREVKLYVNGRMIEQSTFDTPLELEEFVDSSLRIGHGLNGGAIDDIMLFDTALTEAQINQVKGGFIDSSCSQLPEPQPRDSCVQLPGIIAWWPAEDKVEDIISGSLGSMEEGMQFTEGVIGKAFWNPPPKEESESRLVRAKAILDEPLDLSGASTIMLWAKTSDAGYFIESPSSSKGISLGNDLVGEGSGLNARKSPADISSPYTVSKGFQLPADEWTHVALTTDDANENVKLYANGVLIAYKSAPPQRYFGQLEEEALIKELWFGFRIDAAVDEVIIFDRELSREEIMSVVTAGSNGVCRQ